MPVTDTYIETDRWMTAGDMAEYLACSVANLRIKRRQGLLPRALKINHKVFLWKGTEVIAWADAGMPPLEQWERMKAAERRPSRRRGTKSLRVAS